MPQVKMGDKGESIDFKDTERADWMELLSSDKLGRGTKSLRMTEF